MIHHLRALAARFRGLFGDRMSDREINDEIEEHLRLLTERYVRQGMTKAEAASAARRQFGNVALLKEASREMRGIKFIETIFQDLRYGLWMLRRNPGFTFVAVLTLALGIGANTAIFSVVNAVLLRPLPYKDSEQLVVVAESWPARNLPQLGVDPDTFVDWQEQNHVFADMAAFADGQAVLTGDGEPEEVVSQSVTHNLFALLSAGAALGRTFIPDDGKLDRLQVVPRVVLISHSLWQRRFGGDPSVIGRKLRMSLVFPGEATIVGVMPPDFQWRVKVGKPADLWTPLVPTRGHSVWQGRFLTAIARLKPGVSVMQAQAEMSTIAARIAKQYPNYHAELSATVVPLHEQLYGDLRLALLVLFGAVAFVLLIACANVANLLLSRAAARGKEIALRSALGASRLRIIGQLLTESLLLTGLGGAAGLALAIWGVKLLISMSPPNLLTPESVRISAPLLIFTLGVSLATSLFIGLVPVYGSLRLNLHDAIKESSRSVADSRRNGGLRRLLVITEIALALVLLIGAGLLINSLVRLQAVDPGFNPRNVLTLRVSRNWQYSEQQRIEFFKQAVARLQTLPGVKAAGAITDLPFASPAGGSRFYIEGRPRPPAGQDLITKVCVTDANYFDAMQIPLRRGRLFTAGEATEARGLVLINEALARRYFPNEDPIGKHLSIQFRPPTRNPPVMIIGIVGDVKQITLDGAAEPTVYWPHSELALPSMTLVVRTSDGVLNMAAAVRQVIRSLDPQQPVAELRTMESLLAGSMSRAQFNAVLLAVFALVALILALIGIYGVMAYAVRQRTQEIGIRIALGAQASNVLKLVITEGMTLALIGVVIGLIMSLVLTRLMKTLLFSISATDLMTFALIIASLTAIVLLACYIPARRATRVDPLLVLRCE
ncbi:MAG TPA: ABC transporter permease [Blastocatellia bacterium]|nr:ABC transporter permease [Blastocatellia bacterium]